MCDTKKGVFLLEYNFSQHVTKEDYIAFVTNHMKMSFFKPFNIVLFVISVGYLAASPFILGTNDYTFLFIGLGIILLLVGMVFYARKNAAKTYDKNSDQFTMSYKVDDEGLTYILGEGQLQKQWMEFYSATENDDYMYVYVNKNSGLVLVKRDVPVDALRFIRSKLTEHVTPAKRVKVYQNN